ncbi:hypothetical protein [Herbaspirillum seropedicae]|uniref:hypothetical protein n=1 Tax=Herbaspirillum seropedicae TaxID=964 RepID=UPI003FCCD3FA
MHHLKRKAAAFVLGAIAAGTLTGCVGLDAVYLAGTVTSQNINIVARAESDVPTRDGVKVYPVAMKQQTSYFTTPCHYQGLLVEFARDWEEVQAATGTLLPPEPDKPIGYALILTSEQCPEKPARPLFSLDEKYFHFLTRSRGDYVIREGQRMDAVDFSSYAPDQRPKWLPQVLRTIHDEAPRNRAAQQFENEMEARPEWVRKLAS